MTDTRPSVLQVESDGNLHHNPSPSGSRGVVPLSRIGICHSHGEKIVSQEQNAGIALQLLAGIGEGADPDEIARLFSVDVKFGVAGDVGVLPWIGEKIGRSAAADFIRGTRYLTEPIRFDVQGILADDDRAVIIGELASRIKASGKIIETAFAIILTIAEGQITRFQMLEDSFAVSRAARHPLHQARS
jgi:ketosteroid isomerase-like protein